METLWQDIRYGVRMLRKNPGFAFVAMVTLALGIGANAAIFSIMDAVLLDPFPYKDQHQLQQHRPKSGASGQILHGGPEYLAYREQQRSFIEVAAVETVSRNITVGGEEPERLFGAKVSDNFFTMLGVNTVAGRILRPEEQGPGKASLLVIGYGFWQRRFGGDPGVIGRKVELDCEPFTIVGVMPARFLYRGTEFWFPFPFSLADPPRTQRWYQVLARLDSGVSLGDANAELQTVAHRIERDHSASNREYAGWNVRSLPLAVLYFCLLVQNGDRLVIPEC